MPHIVRATPFALMDETTQRAFEDALPGSGSRRSTTLIDFASLNENQDSLAEKACPRSSEIRCQVWPVALP